MTNEIKTTNKEIMNNNKNEIMIYEDKELQIDSTCKKFLQVQYENETL